MKLGRRSPQICMLSVGLIGARDAEMRKTFAVIGLLVVWLFAIEPATRLLWAPLRPALGRAMEVVVLPFRLVRLSAQPPDAVLLMPVAGAQVARITDTWGAPRPGGRRHQGQDIFARQGTAVRSATRGYVVRMGANALGGWVVLIVGAGGRRYYYAHLDAFAPDLRVGTSVTPETIIGFVGNTGNAARTPPHLHFAVYAVGGAVNPLPMLQDRVPSSSSRVPAR
jgi:peptidoglycan LD-endopeptidase LytH